MSLFPINPQRFYDSGGSNIKSRMETCYSEGLLINQSWWNEAHLNFRFYCCDATLWNGVYGGANFPLNRRTFNFNMCRPTVNLIEGYQRKNRKTLVATPIENGDNHTADQLTKVMMWVMNQDNMHESISRAFQSALIGGMSMLKFWIDYSKDPVSGNLRLDVQNYDSIIIDPFWRKPDLSDCNYIWQRSYVTPREALALLPDFSNEILGPILNPNGGPRDGKFYYMPESFNFTYKNKISYDEFYYRDYREQKMLVDVKTGETTEYRGQDEDELRRFLQMHPQITVVKQTVPTVKLAISLNGNILSDGPSPLGTDDYPMLPVLAYYQPEMPEYPLRLQSVITGLRDPQFLYNRFLVIIADIFESQINSGWKYKENALVNPLDVFLNGQGKGLALKTDAAMTDVEKITPADAPQGMFNILETFRDLIHRTSNVNEELMGSAIDDKAGILSMLRQGAGLTGLQPLFDQLDQSCKLLGKKMIDIIQANFMPGKVQKILEGEQPSDFFYNKSFGQYHCVVEEGLLTSTQRQMQFSQMVQLRELGVPVTEQDMLEAATIQNKQKIIDNAMKQQQQTQQMQQQQSQMQMAEIQARIHLANSQAEANTGLGLERASRVEENRAIAIERVAEAHQADAQAELDRAKTLKELAALDLGEVRQLLEMAALLKDKNNPQPEGVV